MLTRPDRARGEADHLWPEMLPGGQAVLFTITPVNGGLDAAQVAVLDLSTGRQTVVVRGGSQAHYVLSGHLVYAAGGMLRAVAFDLARLTVQGTPVPVVSRLVTTGFGAADFNVAIDGTLVYVDAPGGVAFNTLLWVDRKGREMPVGAPPQPTYQQPRLSPDGTRVVVYRFDQESDVWIWDLGRKTLTRLTSERGADQFPVWTPDSRHLLFSSQQAGAANLYGRMADGTGAAERLTEGLNDQRPTAISPDGTRVVFQEVTPGMARDLMMLTLGPERPSTSSGRGEPVEPRRVSPLLQTRFDERNGTISPDGHWLAYESDSSGQFEIYVRPFPNVGDGQGQVSTGGGTQPLWARSGSELFYIAPDGALMAVPVAPRGSNWGAGAPSKLFEGGYVTTTGTLARQYDVAPDGQRFLMIKQGLSDQAAAPQIVVVQHWFEELKRLVPPVR